ncbi:MAG: hypothetical protein HY538_03645 [Deltaproteobacteria bacterium]|nr:hypothetical protein [Deltaproteobacteria bacterium]
MIRKKKGAMSRSWLTLAYAIIGLSVAVILLTLGVVVENDPFQQPIPDAETAPETITGSFSLSFNLSDLENCDNVDGLPEYIDDPVKEACFTVASQEGNKITLDVVINGKKETLTGEVRGSTMIFQKQETLSQGSCSVDYFSSMVIPTVVTTMEIDNASEVVILDMKGECVGTQKTCKVKFYIKEWGDICQ